MALEVPREKISRVRSDFFDQWMQLHDNPPLRHPLSVSNLVHLVSILKYLGSFIAFRNTRRKITKLEFTWEENIESSTKYGKKLRYTMTSTAAIIVI